MNLTAQVGRNLRQIYDISRDVYFLLKDSGSPRQGELFDMKNHTKAMFKSVMRFIRSHGDLLRKDSLAKKLLCKYQSISS